MSRRINKFFLPRPDDLPQLVTPNGEPIPYAQLLAIDVDNVSSEYETHAAWQATIGYAHAKACSAVERKQRELDRLRAQKYFDYQTVFIKDGVKATEKAMSNAIDVDKEVMEVEDELDRLTEHAEILESAVKAFVARKDMIIQLGAEERSARPKLLRREE